MFLGRALPTTEEPGARARRRHRFRGNPFLFLGPRPVREARLRSSIVVEHRRGRSLSSILSDPYVQRCGSESFCWHVLEDSRTIAALEDNFRRERPRG